MRFSLNSDILASTICVTLLVYYLQGFQAKNLPPNLQEFPKFKVPPPTYNPKILTNLLYSHYLNLLFGILTKLVILAKSFNSH